MRKILKKIIKSVHMWYVFGLVCELLYIWNHLLNKKSSKNRASTYCKTVSMTH